MTKDVSVFLFEAACRLSCGAMSLFKHKGKREIRKRTHPALSAATRIETLNGTAIAAVPFIVKITSLLTQSASGVWRRAGFVRFKVPGIGLANFWGYLPLSFIP